MTRRGRRRLGVAAALVDGALVRGDVIVADGLVSEVGAQPAATDGLAVPGFVDVQVNGFAGVDFAATDLEGHRRASRALAATGVTALLASLPTAAPHDYGPALRLAGAACAAPLGGARLLGVHLEGPFLAPGRAGAHRRDWLRPPSPAVADELLGAGPVRLMTLAPELDGALDLVAHLGRRGVAVSLGHSDATAATAHQAFDAGARAITHLWNAHRPVTARDPGIGGAALARPGVYVCLIADGVHLAPETLLFSLAASRGRAVVVTDAVSPAGLGDGEYQFGQRAVTLAGGAVRLADGTLAGSAGTMDGALRHLVSLGVPLAEAVDALSARPAALLGRPDLGRLAPGVTADVTVLGEGLTVRRALVGGDEV